MRRCARTLRRNNTRLEMRETGEESRREEVPEERRRRRGRGEEFSLRRRPLAPLPRWLLLPPPSNESTADATPPRRLYLPRSPRLWRSLRGVGQMRLHRQLESKESTADSRGEESRK